MFCFMFMIVAFFITTGKSCGLAYQLGAFAGCPAYKRIYIIYKKLESILTNDTESLHTMRQGFFPASVTHFFETERVNIVRIRVCWVPNETRPPPACNRFDSNNQTAINETQCLNFRWSGLPSLNMIAVEQLLAFDPVLTSWVYSRFVDHTYYRSFPLVFDISPDLFSCTPSEDDLTQATVLLLTWVSGATYTHTHLAFVYICMQYLPLVLHIHVELSWQGKIIPVIIRPRCS